MSLSVVLNVKWNVLFLSTALIFGQTNLLRAEDLSSETIRTATIKEMHGTVEIRHAGEASWQPAAKNMVLNKGASLRTGIASSVDLVITGGEGSEVRVVENTEFTFEQLDFDHSKGITKTLLDLTIGKVLISSDDLTPGTDYNVQTPTSLVGIRGTMFEVEVS
jgi:hypothetical protein